VGDFAAPAMLARVQSAFAAWPHSPVERRRIPAPAPQQEIRRQFVPIGSQQAHIYFGHLGIERTHPDFYALQVMDTILGGGAGLTSRIPRKLRDEHGLAYTTYASITGSAGIDPGKFVAYIGTSPENISRAIDGFVHEIRRISTEPVDQAELDDAKAYLTGSFVFAFESNSQIARFLINAEVFGLGFDFPEKYPAYIDTVTVQDVLRVAARHLSTERYSIVIAGPEGAMPDP
jgi:zinc protease